MSSGLQPLSCGHKKELVLTVSRGYVRSPVGSSPRTQHFFFVWLKNRYFITVSEYRQQMSVNLNGGAAHLSNASQLMIKYWSNSKINAAFRERAASNECAACGVRRVVRATPSDGWRMPVSMCTFTFVAVIVVVCDAVVLYAADEFGISIKQSILPIHTLRMNIIKLDSIEL